MANYSKALNRKQKDRNLVDRTAANISLGHGDYYHEPTGEWYAQPDKMSSRNWEKAKIRWAEGKRTRHQLRPQNAYGETKIKLGGRYIKNKD